MKGSLGNYVCFYNTIAQVTAVSLRQQYKDEMKITNYYLLFKSLLNWELFRLGGIVVPSN